MKRRSFLAAAGMAVAVGATRAATAETDREAVIDPLRPIVDPHHHLWDNPGSRYLFPELLGDLGEGHNIVQTVFVECGSMYRADGPAPMRVIGETEFANGVAAMSASGKYGACRAVSGIVGAADLTLGEEIRPVLEAHSQAAGSRFRGIRVRSAWDKSPLNGFTSDPANETLLANPSFRRGFALLEPMGLGFDAWCYHPQIPDVTNLARAFPGITIVLDHLGGPLRIGPYAADLNAAFGAWKTAMRELAKCPNVFVKLGGLGMNTFTHLYQRRPRPNSEQLATEWRPTIETAIEAFGADRCMFESNFPVDSDTCSYRTLWNVFKKIAAGASVSEKTALFFGTAKRVYRLDDV
jgi:predicted TIM-barrel fold metal-dependent hydrolase